MNTLKNINRKSFLNKCLIGIGAIFGVKSTAANKDWKITDGAQSFSINSETTDFTGISGHSGFDLNQFNIADRRDKNGKITHIEIEQKNGLRLIIDGKDINILLDSVPNFELKPNIKSWRTYSIDNIQGENVHSNIDLSKEMLYVQ